MGAFVAYTDITGASAIPSQRKLGSPTRPVWCRSFEPICSGIKLLYAIDDERRCKSCHKLAYRGDPKIDFDRYAHSCPSQITLLECAPASRARHLSQAAYAAERLPPYRDRLSVLGESGWGGQYPHGITSPGGAGRLGRALWLRASGARCLNKRPSRRT